MLNTQKVTFPKVTETGAGTGEWLDYTVDGSVRVTLTKTDSSPNSVLAGIFLN